MKTGLNLFDISNIRQSVTKNTYGHSVIALAYHVISDHVHVTMNVSYPLEIEKGTKYRPIGNNKLK